MKKEVYKLLLLCISSFLLTACSDDENTPDNPTQVAPGLVSSTPTDGATNIPEGDLTITLIFDQNVTSPATGHSDISLGEATITTVSANLTQVTIQATGLKKGTTYQLIIPKGVIVGPAQVEVPEVKISFSTVADIPLTNSLCTPNPTPEAQKIYNYIVETYENKIISAAMANVNWNTEQADRVYTLTGKYPAMNCFDYIHLPFSSPGGWIDYDDIAPVKNWWDAGGLVSISWHWNVPKHNGADGLEGYAFYRSETSFDADNATTEGTWENEVFTADMAKIAASLKTLQNEGVVVLWRPFHEAAGGWFWWGKNASSCKKLWITMFNYFQREGINNLIWVWTSEPNDTDWYPGDEYVDIVGCDLYEKDATACASRYNSEKIRYTNKVIALSECGTVGLLSAQWEAGARWSWVMPWYDNDSSETPHATDEWWIDAMSQSYVIDRDQLSVALH